MRKPAADPRRFSQSHGNTEWILELSDETKKPMFRIRLVAGASLVSDVGCWRKAAVHIQTGSRGR
jgi:hypothetical protein